MHIRHPGRTKESFSLEEEWGVGRAYSFLFLEIGGGTRQRGDGRCQQPASKLHLTHLVQHLKVGEVR